MSFPHIDLRSLFANLHFREHGVRGWSVLRIVTIILMMSSTNKNYITCFALVCLIKNYNSPFKCTFPLYRLLSNCIYRSLHSHHHHCQVPASHWDGMAGDLTRHCKNFENNFIFTSVHLVADDICSKLVLNCTFVRRSGSFVRSFVLLYERMKVVSYRKCHVFLVKCQCLWVQCDLCCQI